MKRSLLTISYLTVLNTFVLAQTTAPMLAAEQSNSFVPLLNEPFFPGGQQALTIYMNTHDFYPLHARDAYLEGTVRVKFRVEPNGCLTHIHVVKSRGPLLDQAAVQTVMMMPRWYPAHRAGIAVARQVELPITFRLD